MSGIEIGKEVEVQSGGLVPAITLLIECRANADFIERLRCSPAMKTSLETRSPCPLQLARKSHLTSAKPVIVSKTRADRPSPDAKSRPPVQPA